MTARENFHPDFLDAIRTRTNIVALVGRRVKLTPKSGAYWGLCPFHTETDASFKVENGRHRYHCFGCGADGDAYKWLQETEGLTFPEAVTQLAGEDPFSNLAHAPLLPPPPDPQAAMRQAEAEAKRIRNAVAIFEQADDIQNTPAWGYLKKRGVEGGLPSSCGHALRWHTKCPWELGTQGCMVALFTDALTGEPKGIHRTAITSDGEKIGRLSLGLIAGCVIRLWPAISHRLVTGEGIESCLGAHRFRYFADEGAVRRIRDEDSLSAVPPGEILSPCWAAGFTENLAKLPAIPGVPKIFILVDHDKNGAGQKAALECAQRWHAAGRKVIRLTSGRLGEDFASNPEVAP